MTACRLLELAETPRQSKQRAAPGCQIPRNERRNQLKLEAADWKVGFETVQLEGRRGFLSGGVGSKMECSSYRGWRWLLRRSACGLRRSAFLLRWLETSR